MDTVERYSRYNGPLFDASLLASCGADRRVRVWDLTKVGMHPTISVDSECPEELLFIHGGHNDKVSDISWNPMQDWVVASSNR